MKTKYLMFGLFFAFAYYELIYTPTGSVSSVPNNPSNANALGIPTAPISASTLTPAQLGTGLFDDAAELGSQQPNIVPGAPT